MGKRLVACVLTVLLLGSCAGDGGSVAQPDDEFLDSVESLCRDAAQAIRKLDTKDAGAPAELLDILSGTADDLSALDPPRSVAKAYDQYTSNLDDQVAQIEALASARAAGDTDTERSAGDQIDVLRADNDGIVNTLRISSCRGITPPHGLAASGTADTTPDSTPDTTPDTTADTTADTDVVTPNTPLPIDDPSATTGDTSTDDTANTQTLAAYDASTAFQPIDGYTWGTLDVTGTFTPGDDAVLGPIVASYGVGVMDSTADGSAVFVYATTLVDGVSWTPESTSSYFEFELAADGTDVTLPASGLAARVKAPAFEGTDVAVCTRGTQGFAIFADAGTDVAGLLDRFVTAQGG